MYWHCKKYFIMSSKSISRMIDNVKKFTLTCLKIKLQWNWSFFLFFSKWGSEVSMKKIITLTNEWLPTRRTLPLATAMDSANGRESSLVYITPFLKTKSATGWDKCDFQAQKSENVKEIMTKMSHTSFTKPCSSTQQHKIKV